MDICHAHNLIEPLPRPGRYGIRVRLKPTDTFARVIGTGWQQLHWYRTAEARDRALADMASEHLYSRRGDRPTVVFEAIERTAEEAAAD